MSNKDKIYAFWGAMDLLAIASYLFFALQRGNIPFWTDIQHFYANLAFMEVRGADSILLQGVFFLYLGLMLSLFFSAWCFLKRKAISFLFIGVQEILRLFSLSCSVAIFPLLLQFMQVENVLVAIVLFVVSEALKTGSIFWIRKQGC